MFKLIFFAIIIFIVLMAFSVFRFVLKLFFGKPFSSVKNYTNQNRRESSHPSDSESQRSNTKVFAKDEGEYVDYEEIKD